MTENHGTSEQYSHIMARLQYRMEEVGKAFVALSTKIEELQRGFQWMPERLRASEDVTSKETRSP